MDEVRPFLHRVLAGRPVPAERIDEVVEHYRLIGGRSPLPELTRRQAAALDQRLKDDGIELPLRIGNRNSEPFLEQALRELSEGGAGNVAGLILAAHESPASHGRYQEAVERALAALGDAAPDVQYTPSFHLHPGFVRAHADHVRAALARIDPVERTGARLIFTAHSIPSAVADRSPYEGQLQSSAEAVAEAAGIASFRIAYQSRSGNPREAWLEPDINDAIRQEAGSGVRQLLLSPLGFVCDHVEVLYDLDIEAAETAKQLGVGLSRAAAPNDHPAFIEALADCVSAVM
jgi:ferrochelatase